MSFKVVKKLESMKWGATFGYLLVNEFDIPVGYFRSEGLALRVRDLLNADDGGVLK